VVAYKAYIATLEPFRHLRCRLEEGGSSFHTRQFYYRLIILLLQPAAGAVL
jgi:hypothetical protein